MSSVASPCDGSRYCEAEQHIHGCFADKGKCDEPGEHDRELRDLRRERRLEALREALVAALNGRTVRHAIAWDVLREWDRMVEADRG